MIRINKPTLNLKVGKRYYTTDNFDTNIVEVLSKDNHYFHNVKIFTTKTTRYNIVDTVRWHLGDWQFWAELPNQDKP